MIIVFFWREFRVIKIQMHLLTTRPERRCREKEKCQNKREIKKRYDTWVSLGDPEKRKKLDRSSKGSTNCLISSTVPLQCVQLLLRFQWQWRVETLDPCNKRQNNKRCIECSQWIMQYMAEKIVNLISFIYLKG